MQIKKFRHKKTLNFWIIDCGCLRKIVFNHFFVRRPRFTTILKSLEGLVFVIYVLVQTNIPLNINLRKVRNMK